jgi:glyoxalase family protein
MKLEGVHHVTAITGRAQENVDFYAGTLGLRLVKKTVNQDDPSVYHLFYADEHGSAGSDITFFEYPGARPGSAGDGMVHTVGWRVADDEALGFWEKRLSDAGAPVERGEATLRFEDPEGLAHELRITTVDDQPLIADHPEVPKEVALQGFDGVRAYSSRPQSSDGLLEAIGFERSGDGWEARGGSRGGRYTYDEPPEGRPVPGAGTVHHVAWASQMDEHEQWRERVMSAGGQPTPVIDRFYFRSIYFRIPTGILFEIATLGPGFTADEPLETLGEALSLPPDYERLRDQIERTVTPLSNPRTAAKQG